MGVDLAQKQDFTAITVLECEQVGTGKRVPDAVAQINAGVPDGNYTKPVTENLFTARYLEWLPTGTAYPAQVARIKELHDRLNADTKRAPHLVVDQTGVGRPVVDRLRAAGLQPITVSITGGDAVSRNGRDC